MIEHLKDLLSPLGAIVVKRMFGGAGIYCDGTFFAIVDGDALYFKADEEGRAAFEAEGMGPFTYRTKRGEAALVSYYRAPERLLDEPDEMLEWARRAVAAAQRSAALKAGSSAARAKARGGKSGSGVNLATKRSSRRA